MHIQTQLIIQNTLSISDIMVWFKSNLAYQFVLILQYRRVPKGYVAQVALCCKCLLLPDMQLK